MPDRPRHPDTGGLRGRIEAVAREGGVRAFGVADMEAAERAVPTIFDRVGARYRRAIAMAIPLNPAALEGITDRPTPLYFHAYRQLNYQLDTVALAVAAELAEEGHRSLAIAASQIVNHTPPQGHVSSRHIAAAAGIGWIGRSGLLVTPRYGARVRLVVVLTDALLDAGRPMPFSCGKCAACVKVCPAGAIAGSPDGFNLDACYAKLTEFTKIAYVGQHICGVCVKACAAGNPGRAVDADAKSVEV
jgi:epoxyqueuosine reductase QueG